MSVLCQLPGKLEHVTGRASCKALCKWYCFSEAGRILRQPGSRKAGEPQVQGTGRKVEARGEKVTELDKAAASRGFPGSVNNTAKGRGDHPEVSKRSGTNMV